MINKGDNIKFSNVISKKIYIHYNDLELEMKKFLTQLANLGAIPYGNIFYSINNVPTDEMLLMELFCPVKNEKVKLMSNMYFHSYYCVENMITYNVHTNIEKNMEVAYAIILDALDYLKVKQITPFYHVVSKDKNIPYIKLGIGVF